MINNKKHLDMPNNINNLKNWKSISEQRHKETLSKEGSLLRNKVIYKPIGSPDKGTFKVKIIRDLDVLDSTGKLTQQGWGYLKKWLMDIRSFQKDYGQKIQNPKDFKVLYTVDKDKREGQKQVLSFKIVTSDDVSQTIQIPDTQQIIPSNYLDANVKQSILADLEQSKAQSDPTAPGGGDQQIADKIGKGKAGTGTDSEAGEETGEAGKEGIDVELLKKSGITMEGLPITRGGGVNENVKKYQKIVIDKFDSLLGDIPIFQKFKNYGTDGRFGPTTSVITKGLKAGYGFKNTDGDIVDGKLLTSILSDKSVSESVDVNEAFSVDAFKQAVAPKTGGKGVSFKEDITSEFKNEEGKVSAEKVWQYQKKLMLGVKNLFKDSGTFKDAEIIYGLTYNYFKITKLILDYWKENVEPKYGVMEKAIKSLEKSNPNAGKIMRGNLDAIKKVKFALTRNANSKKNVKAILTKPDKQKVKFTINTSLSFE